MPNDHLVSRLKEVHARPGMHFRRVSYDAFSAYLRGLCDATDPGIQSRFKVWLILNRSAPTNLDWAAAAIHCFVKGAERPYSFVDNGDDAVQIAAIDWLYNAFVEFLAGDGSRG